MKEPRRVSLPRYTNNNDDKNTDNNNDKTNSNDYNGNSNNSNNNNNDNNDSSSAPSLPAKIIPAKIARLKLSGKFPMGLGIPPLKSKIRLESDPLKSRILVPRLAVFEDSSMLRSVYI